MTTATKFVAVRKALAGNDLYFTGSDNFTLVDSPYFCGARVHESAEQLQGAVAPWNRMGRGVFLVRPITEDEATELAFEQSRGVAPYQWLQAACDAAGQFSRLK